VLSQNGTSGVLSVESGADLRGLWAGKGFFCLLWGEPGLRRGWGCWVVGSFLERSALTRRPSDYEQTSVNCSASQSLQQVITPPSQSLRQASHCNKPVTATSQSLQQANHCDKPITATSQSLLQVSHSCVSIAPTSQSLLQINHSGVRVNCSSESIAPASQLLQRVNYSGEVKLLQRVDHSNRRLP
jgi:hypothetical protein